MGEREKPTDRMAWNADTTRMPARMHHEYLTSLYLRNALATNSYPVQGRAVALDDIAMPVFLAGTQRDHISPWRSVEGSWWPAWHRWLSRHSSRRRPAQATPPTAVLRDAPGDYVRRRFKD